MLKVSVVDLAAMLGAFPSQVLLGGEGVDVGHNFLPELRRCDLEIARPHDVRVAVVHMVSVIQRTATRQSLHHSDRGRPVDIVIVMFGNDPLH